jgi:tetratricopeptide (TPR) repeat protein
MTRKLVLFICALEMCLTLTAAKCSREHVQSVEMMNECVKFHRRKLFPQAIRDCTKAVSLDPQNEKAQYSLGMVYLETKEYEQSARHLQKAIAITGDVALYHYRIGEVYQWMGQPEQAAKSLQQTVEIEPSLFKAHYRLGRVYEEMDEPQKAMQKYTETLQHNPRFFEAYRELGSLYADFGFQSHALQVFDEGIKALEGRGDDLAVLRHLKGTVLAEKKEYDSAIKEFRAALELRPNMEDAMFSLGWSYSYVNPENAKIWLRKFVQSASQKTRSDYVAAANNRLAEIEQGVPLK